MLLGPERVIEAEGPASEILRRCDGSRTVGEIVDELAALYTADRAEIEGDVNEMLAELASEADAGGMSGPALSGAARAAGGTYASLSPRLPILLEPADLGQPGRRAGHGDLGARVSRGCRDGRAAGPPVGRRTRVAPRPGRDRRRRARRRALHQPDHLGDRARCGASRTAEGGRAGSCAAFAAGRGCGIRRPDRRLSRRAHAETRLRAIRGAARPGAHRQCSDPPRQHRSRRRAGGDGCSRSAPGGWKSPTRSITAGRCATARP